MTIEELKVRQLANQHLITPADKMTVLHDLCGVQAQFMVNAMHALRIRCSDYDEATVKDGLVKNWTVRGTVHVFAEEDLPLFLHCNNGRDYRRNDWRGYTFWNQRDQWALTPQRQAYFAAQDLRHGKTPIIDIAMKYGYDSAAAFSRAFAKQHGITPSVYRKEGGSLKVYPPASFHILIKGAKEMDFRMIELEDTLVYGVSKQYEGMGYKTREELRHSMWADNCDDVPGQLCEGGWNQPGSTSYDGVWYGVWQDGKYMIAREKADVKTGDLETRTLPAGTYAAFKTECGGLAWEEFPKLFELIFDSWLPASEYKQKYDLAIEVLHLWTDHDLRQKNRYYEVWIPVEKK